MNYDGWDNLFEGSEDCPSMTGQKIREIVESLRSFADSLLSLFEEFQKWYDFINSVRETRYPIPITDRIKARQPRNRIFLEKERRTRQYYPRQNRHARNIIRCR